VTIALQMHKKCWERGANQNELDDRERVEAWIGGGKRMGTVKEKG
jgi:hypothetical protein